MVSLWLLNADRNAGVFCKNEYRFCGRFSLRMFAVFLINAYTDLIMKLLRSNIANFHTVNAVL